jgi:ligand-binding SRPBCC domain-containing protein
MIRRADAPKIFIDEMIQGPFSYWQHRHEFEDGPISGTTLYRDTVIYCVPLGLLGDTIHPWLVYPRLAQVFDYRHQVAFREMRRRIVK